MKGAKPERRNISLPVEFALLSLTPVNTEVKWLIPNGYPSIPQTPYPGFVYPPYGGYYGGMMPGQPFDPAYPPNPYNQYGQMPVDPMDTLEPEPVAELTPEVKQAVECVQLVYNRVAPKFTEATSKKPVILRDFAQVQDWQNYNSIIQAGKAASKFASAVCQTYEGLLDTPSADLGKAFTEMVRKTITDQDVRLLREVNGLRGIGGEEFGEFLNWLSRIGNYSSINESVRRDAEEFSVSSLGSFGGVAMDLESLVTLVSDLNENLQEKKFDKDGGPEAFFNKAMQPLQQFRADVTAIRAYAQSILRLSPAEKKLLPPDVESMARQLMNPGGPGGLGGGLFNFGGGSSMLGGGRGFGAGFGGGQNLFSTGALGGQSGANFAQQAEDPLFVACTLATNSSIMKEVSSAAVKNVIGERKNEEKEQGKALLSIAWAKAMIKIMNNLSTSSSSALHPELKKHNDCIISLMKDSVTGPFAKLIGKDFGSSKQEFGRSTRSRGL